MTMSLSGYRCSQCRPGKPCSFCLSLAAAKRREEEPQPEPMAPQQEQIQQEPEQGHGFDRGYDYTRGRWRVPRRAL